MSRFTLCIRARSHPDSQGRVDVRPPAHRESLKVEDQCEFLVSQHEAERTDQYADEAQTEEYSCMIIISDARICAAHLNWDRGNITTFEEERTAYYRSHCTTAGKRRR